MADQNVQQLSVTLLADRIRHLPSVQYVNANALVKSAVVVISAMTLLSILSKSLSFDSMRDRMVFWSLSAMMSGVTQITWARGYVFTTSRIGILDFYAPIWVGVFEVLLFQACDPTLNLHIADLEQFSSVWLIFLGFHALAATVLVWNRVYETADSDFDAQLREVPLRKEQRPLANLYKSWIRHDGYATAVICVLALGASVLAWCHLLDAFISPTHLVKCMSLALVLPTFLVVSFGTLRQLKIVERAILDKYS